MKALLFEAVGRIRFAHVPDAVITDPDQVLVRVAAASICGSDVHGYQGRPPGRTPPLVMGHETSGEVVAVGSSVDNVAPGDRIFVLPGVSCMRCEACLDGRWDDCRERRFYGANMAGGFAEHLVIASRAAIPIPAEVSFQQAALIEPLSVALKSVSRLHFIPGDTSVVIGAGPIGLMATALLARYSPRNLIVINRNRERDPLLRKLGASVVLDPAAPDLVQTVLDLTDGVGADQCIEAVGVSATMQRAIDVTKPGGTVVWAGNISTTIEIDEIMAVFNQLSIVGTMGVTRSGVLRSIRLIASRAVDVELLLSLKAPLSEGAAVFERLVHDRSIIKAMFVAA